MLVAKRLDAIINFCITCGVQKFKKFVKILLLSGIVKKTNQVTHKKLVQGKCVGGPISQVHNRINTKKGRTKVKSTAEFFLLILVETKQ